MMKFRDEESSMLILSRGYNQRVIIGDGDEKVVITVVEIAGGRVRLGFEAPRSVQIHREEVYERLKDDGRTEKK